MQLLLIVLVLLILFGGGGYWHGGHTYGIGGIVLVAVVILIVLAVTGRFGLYLLVTGLSLALTACASGNVSFPVGAFALMYADVSGTVSRACVAKKIPNVECVQLAIYDKDIRAKIVEPKREMDWEKMLEMVGKLAKMAI